MNKKTLEPRSTRPIPTFPPSMQPARAGEEEKRHMNQFIENLFTDDGDSVLAAWDATYVGIVEFFDMYTDFLPYLQYDTPLYWEAIHEFTKAFAKAVKVEGKSLIED